MSSSKSFAVTLVKRTTTQVVCGGAVQRTTTVDGEKYFWSGHSYDGMERMRR